MGILSTESFQQITQKTPEYFRHAGARGGGGLGAVAPALFCHYVMLKAYVSNRTTQRDVTYAYCTCIQHKGFLPLPQSQSMSLRCPSMNLSDHVLIGHAQSSKPPHSKTCSGVPVLYSFSDTQQV